MWASTLSERANVPAFFGRKGFFWFEVSVTGNGHDADGSVEASMQERRPQSPPRQLTGNRSLEMRILYDVVQQNENWREAGTGIWLGSRVDNHHGSFFGIATLEAK